MNIMELPIPGESGNRIIPLRESGIRFHGTRILYLHWCISFPCNCSVSGPSYTYLWCSKFSTINILDSVILIYFTIPSHVIPCITHLNPQLPSPYTLSILPNISKWIDCLFTPNISEILTCSYFSLICILSTPSSNPNDSSPSPFLCIVP